MRRLTTLLLICTAAACGADTNARSMLTAAVDTVDGVERLSYPADAASPLPWRFDTLAVIGGAMVEDANYQFQGASRQQLAGNAQGHLFLIDEQGHRILRYDTSGTFVRSYGREGGGPGELRSPRSIALGPGDSLWVPDMQNRRITVYDAAGGGSRSISAADGQGMNLSSVSLGAANYYRTMRDIMAAMRAHGDDRPTIPLVRFAPDGTLLDTVWRYQPAPTNAVRLEAGGSAVTFNMSQVFAPRFRWTVLSDGRVVVSDSANYVLHIVAPDGMLERTIRRDPPARATTEADREAARERERERGRSGLRFGNVAVNGEDFARQLLENMTFAPVIPRITDLAVDPQDRIWVGVSIDGPGEAERIDVYDAAGRLLGEIQDPAFFPDLVYGPGLAALLTEDEFEVQQVVVMRLVE